jgi:hypothetical protein
MGVALSSIRFCMDFVRRILHGPFWPSHTEDLAGLYFGIGLFTDRRAGRGPGCLSGPPGPSGLFQALQALQVYFSGFSGPPGLFQAFQALHIPLRFKTVPRPARRSVNLGGPRIIH